MLVLCTIYTHEAQCNINEYSNNSILLHGIASLGLNPNPSRCYIRPSRNAAPPRCPLHARRGGCWVLPHPVPPWRWPRPSRPQHRATLVAAGQSAPSSKIYTTTVALVTKWSIESNHIKWFLQYLLNAKAKLVSTVCSFCYLQLFQSIDVFSYVL